MASRSLLDGKRVLIVDDEPDVLETLEELLPMCQTVRATRFDEAKELLENQRFDMAILDIMGVNGYQLLALACHKNVIPIMLTAHALSPEDVVKSFKEGAAFYMPKDEIVSIRTFLLDVLEAKKKGKHPWSRWLERLGDYFARKFGPNWQSHDKEFWENIAYYGPY
jgi:DNA-binding NtrC family response regulator